MIFAPNDDEMSIRRFGVWMCVCLSVCEREIAMVEEREKEREEERKKEREINKYGARQTDRERERERKRERERERERERARQIESPVDVWRSGESLVEYCNTRNTLKHTATPATHCNSCITLQHTATHCNTLPYTAYIYIFIYGSELQC